VEKNSLYFHFRIKTAYTHGHWFDQSDTTLKYYNISWN